MIDRSGLSLEVERSPFSADEPLFCVASASDTQAMRRFLLLVTVVSQITPSRTVSDVCHSRHFHSVRGNEPDDYLIYGLTQDCQIFFIRPSQLSLLSTLRVNLHNSYCYPNLVQIHVQSSSSMLLLLKQAGNRICTLEVQIPQPDMLFGDHLFSYSLLASIPYSACSTSPPNGFSLETDLSYMDSVYKDVIYFIDGRSEGALWTVHQFLLTDQGYLRKLEKIPINHHSKRKWTGPDLSSEYVVGLDAQRNYLYKRSRFESNYLYECAFDLMYRPNDVSVHQVNVTEKPNRTWLNSLSADKNVLIFTETDRSVSPAVTRVFAQNVSSGHSAFCLASTEFSFDIGIIRMSTLHQMKDNPLGSFLNAGKGTSSTSSAYRFHSSTPRSSTRRTNLKATTVLSSSADTVISSTHFESTTTQEYEEEFEDELDDDDQTTKKDQETRVLSTDKNRDGGIALKTSTESIDASDIIQNITDSANMNGTKAAGQADFKIMSLLFTASVLYSV